jgi:tRNA nucleotidyltransferase (CCA-adding enzyme)
VDNAAKIADRDGLDKNERATLIFSAMSHDFAKPSTTQKEDKNGVERITSKGHEEAGGPLAYQFLQSIGIPEEMARKVQSLVENHLAHLNFQENLSEKTVRKMVNKLADKLHINKANIEQLVRLIEADHSGRANLEKGITPPQEIPSRALFLRDQARQFGVNEGAIDIHNKESKVQPFITGKIILSRYPEAKKWKSIVGQVINDAMELQKSGDIENFEQALVWLDNNIDMYRLIYEQN